MKKFAILFFLLLAVAARAVIVTVDPWVPIFKGIDLAHGRQQKESAGEREHQVQCLRVDLSDPDVKFLTTPHCTNGCAGETLSENASLFLERSGLQAVVNGSFYESSQGPSDLPIGSPYNVEGLAISQGNVVSPADQTDRATAFLFTTNNSPIFLPTNAPPGTNTSGIYTALTGDRPLLINGTNVQTGGNTNDLDPRTATGLSQDRRYLYLMTIDGRQPGWSDGADFSSTAEWLKRFGAWDGINIDGGGSTLMCIADCAGKSARVNRSSFVFQQGRERQIGHHFGIFAPPLPADIKDFSVSAGSTTATITWRTEEPATTQVQYGPTASYGTNTPLDARLVRNHVATLRGLQQGSNYFFRAVSVTDGGQTLTQACRFTTVISLARTQIFDVTNSWSYTTNNLDGTLWKTRTYVENNWMGTNRGLLYVNESASYISPLTTQLPGSSTAIPRTYYFRTHFNHTGSVAGAQLTLSNYVDDGAVFYLNGAEIFRLRMPQAPTVITYATASQGTPCAGTAQSGDTANSCPDVFTISGPLLTTNLLQGDNVLAVEVHNSSSGSLLDLVFGSSLTRSLPALVLPRLTLWTEQDEATLFWNGEGFTLQQSPDLNSPDNWSNAPGASAISPYVTTNTGTGTLYYRLKN